MIKTGQAWAGTFVTLDATGALAAGSPAGALYVDGVANAATVTITGTNPYRWAVTLPTLTAGQRVDMYITATIATIATAGIVASEQADTALTSEVKAETASILADTGTDGVKIASGELSTVATASSITALDGKIDTIDNFLDTEVAAILADTNELQAELADGGRTDLLIDAIKLKTDLIPATPAQAGEYTAAIAAVQADLDNPDQYKADVSALATTAHVQEVEDKVDIVDGIADAILDDTGTTGVLLSTSALGSIFDDEVIVGTYTFSDLLKIMAAALAGKATGGGTTEVKFSGVDDAPNVIVATVDANGNRSAVTLTV